MTQIDTSKVSRWDQHGREHVVRVRREQGAFRARKRAWYPWRAAALIALLAVAFMLI